MQRLSAGLPAPSRLLPWRAGARTARRGSAAWRCRRGWPGLGRRGVRGAAVAARQHGLPEGGRPARACGHLRAGAVRVVLEQEVPRAEAERGRGRQNRGWLARTHAPPRSPLLSLTHSPAHSLTHPLPPSLTHLLTHPLTLARTHRRRMHVLQAGHARQSPSLPASPFPPNRGESRRGEARGPAEGRGGGHGKARAVLPGQGIVGHVNARRATRRPNHGHTQPRCARCHAALPCPDLICPGPGPRLWLGRGCRPRAAAATAASAAPDGSRSGVAETRARAPPRRTSCLAPSASAATGAHRPGLVGVEPRQAGRREPPKEDKE